MVALLPCVRLDIPHNLRLFQATLCEVIPTSIVRQHTLSSHVHGLSCIMEGSGKLRNGTGTVSV